MTDICVANASSVLTDEEVIAAIAPLQAQANGDLAKAWDLPTVTLSWLPKLAPTPQGVWALIVLDDSDQAEALGYHDLTAGGLPLAKILREAVPWAAWTGALAPRMSFAK